LLDIIRAKGFGLSMISPITRAPLDFVGYSLVDDNNIVQSDGDDSLSTTTKLQPEKSYWYLVSFNWNGGKWSYAPANDTPATLYMNDIRNVRKAVRRISTNDAEETLGVWIAPNGDTRVQCEKLVEKSRIWADHMRTGSIRKDEAWLAMQTTIWRTFCYPLNAVNLTKAQCEAIMSPVLHYALPAMGVCRNFPRAMVFSPLKTQDLG
jgi:hypothetical protein